jgi:hypothetical protein
MASTARLFSPVSVRQNLFFITPLFFLADIIVVIADCFGNLLHCLGFHDSVSRNLTFQVYSLEFKKNFLSVEFLRSLVDLLNDDRFRDDLGETMAPFLCVPKLTLIH